MFTFLFTVIGIIGGIYVGGWLMFVSPILECLRAFDAGTLTAMAIGITILKCMFASLVGYSIFYACSITGILIDAFKG